MFYYTVAVLCGSLLFLVALCQHCTIIIISIIIIIIIIIKSTICRAPAYTADMLTAAVDVSSLRAASNDDYIVPRTNSRYGDRAFSVAAPHR